MSRLYETIDPFPLVVSEPLLTPTGSPCFLLFSIFAKVLWLSASVFSFTEIRENYSRIGLFSKFYDSVTAMVLFLACPGLFYFDFKLKSRQVSENYV